MAQTLIRVGHLIDGTGRPPRRDLLLSVADGLITAITPYTQTAPPPSVQLVDLSFATVAPPFVDCLVHLALSATTDQVARLHQEQAPAAEIQALIQRHLLYLFNHGVLAALGEDMVTVSTLPTEPGAPSPGLIPGPAMVRAHGRTQVRQALEAGCPAIVEGFAMGVDNLKAMAERQVMLVPTLSALKVGVELAGSAEERKSAARALALQLEQVALARELGVRVATGTASGRPGLIHGETLVEEIKLLGRAGYSLAEAVRCATCNGARLLGLDGGCLTVGGQADFLVARGTPAQLPRKFSYLEAIYLKGHRCRAYRKNPLKIVD